MCMRGRRLLFREAPSLALPLEELTRKWETPGEAASLREAPPPGPLPKSSWGLGRLLLHTGRPCKLGAPSSGLVVVTAADRAAATCQRWVTTKLQGVRTEGVAGAIGKPPPRLRRGEIPSASADAAPWLPPQRELSCAKRMTEDKPQHRKTKLLEGNVLPFLLNRNASDTLLRPYPADPYTRPRCPRRAHRRTS